MVKQSIPLNFITDGSQPHLKVSQGDTGERVFSFLCFYGRELYSIPQGSHVILNGQKPGGYVFTIQCTYADSTVTVDCTDSMTDVPGPVVCELLVNAPEGITQSANFIMDVEKATIDLHKLPASDFSYFTGIVEEVNAAVQEIEEYGIGEEITQAEYDALTDEEKNSGKIFFIIDGNANPQTAAITPYDNKDSRLEAENVQDAIDETAGKIETLNNDLTNKKSLIALINIDEGADLNTIVDMGEYLASTNALVATLTNTPTTYAFRLTVERSLYQPRYLRQTAAVYNGDTYIRTSTDTGATWTSWKKVVLGDIGFDYSTKEVRFGYDETNKIIIMQFKKDDDNYAQININFSQNKVIFYTKVSGKSITNMGTIAIS